MALPTWPSYAEVRFADYSEEFDPSVIVTEMERGGPKMAVMNSHVVQEVNASVQFRSAQDVADFETWYFNEVKRVGKFTMDHPRTGEPITAWFKEGRIGRLVPLNTLFRFAKRDLVIQYLR